MEEFVHASRDPIEGVMTGLKTFAKSPKKSGRFVLAPRQRRLRQNAESFARGRYYSHIFISRPIPGRRTT